MNVADLSGRINPEDFPGKRPNFLLGALVAGLCIGLGGIFWGIPLPVLIDRFMPDDSFYYYQTARVFARTGFSSFDGLHGTNGYQPLWFVICAAVFRFFPEGGEIPIRIMLGVQVLFYAGAGVLLFAAMRRFAGGMLALMGMAVWFGSSPVLAFAGLETALQMLMLALTMNLYARWRDAPIEKTALGEAMWLGVCSGLLFLARTDSLFTVGPLAIAVSCRMWRGGKRPAIAWFLVPLALLGCGYVLLNLIAYGHAMPVSGAAKIYYSACQRDAALAAGLTPAAAIFKNMMWVLAPENRIVFAGLLGSIVFLLIAIGRPRRDGLGALALFWPFYFGAAAAWLFYNGVFFGSFTKTAWYYSPQMMIAAFMTAGIPAAFPSYRKLPTGERALTGLILPALLLGWGIRLFMLPALAVAAAAWGVYMIRRGSCSFFVRISLIAIGAAGIVGLAFIVPRGHGLHPWILAGLLYFMTSAALLGRASLAWIGPVLLMCAVVAVTGGKLNASAARPPSRWNYNLYLGAMWARENLPPDATIWSDSTGVLGYFSGHTCVNTDGLVNNFDYLENYLKAGRKNEYLTRWDYAIDAMPDDSLKSAFVSGEFIQLPAKYQGPAFQEGPLTRRLRVFKMNSAKR